MTTESRHAGHHIYIKHFNKAGQEICHLDMKDNSGSFRFDAGGKTLKCNSYDNTITIIDGKTHRTLPFVIGNEEDKELMFNDVNIDALRPSQKQRYNWWIKNLAEFERKGLSNLLDTGQSFKDKLGL